MLTEMYDMWAIVYTETHCSLSPWHWLKCLHTVEYTAPGIGPIFFVK